MNFRDVDGRGAYVDTFYWRLLSVSPSTHIFVGRCVLSVAPLASPAFSESSTRCIRGYFN